LRGENLAVGNDNEGIGSSGGLKLLLAAEAADFGCDMTSKKRPNAVVPSGRQRSTSSQADGIPRL